MPDYPTVTLAGSEFMRVGETLLVRAGSIQVWAGMLIHNAEDGHVYIVVDPAQKRLEHYTVPATS
jgi:hypothetical protein